MTTPGARVYPIAGHERIAARLYGFGPLAFRAVVGDGAGANGHGISRCAGARAALCGRCPTGCVVPLLMGMYIRYIFHSCLRTSGVRKWHI